MKIDKKKFTEKNKTKEEDSFSSEDDENAVLLTEDLEKGFLKVLSRLKKKDSDLYKESVDYFSSEISKVNHSYSQEKLGRQQDYKQWLQGQKKKIKDLETKKDLEALHKFWTNPNINKEEQFLRDYILNKKFLEHDDSFDLEKELQNLSEEEKEEEEQTKFEEKYNCRFENPDTEFLQKYPQTLKSAFGKRMDPDKTLVAKSVKGSKSNENKKRGKKRKSLETFDAKTKLSKVDSPNKNDTSNQQLEKAKGGKSKISNQKKVLKNVKDMLNIELDAKSEKKLLKMESDDIKTSIGNILEAFKSKKRRRKMKKIGQVKNGNNTVFLKDKKQKLSKNQNIKQPVSLNNKTKKLRDGKRKPRHRTLKHKI